MSSKAKENCQQRESPLATAQSQPQPKPRPTGKGKRLPQGSTPLGDTSNNDQEVQSVAEALVSMSSSTNAPGPPLATAPIDWHRHAMPVSNITPGPGVPLVTVSDSEVNNNKINQLDSESDSDDDDDNISNTGLSILITTVSSHVNSCQCVYPRPFASS